jgi:hypothetical protein
LEKPTKQGTERGLQLTTLKIIGTKSYNLQKFLATNNHESELENGSASGRPSASTKTQLVRDPEGKDKANHWPDF